MTRLGKYELFEKLGSGANADVYRAQDTTLKRVVALKVLKPALLADEETFQRFVQEAQVASGLFHPHIAIVLDLAEADGRYFIAMRYVDGLSLDKVIAERSPLPWEEAVSILGQVAEALEYAHQRGLVHRDVKPQNILLSPTDGAVLTDFGLVRAMEASGVKSRSGSILGTPQYIPPEVWAGKPALPASDQYALACVFCEMISGQSPFQGETPAELVTQHVIKGPLFPQTWPKDIPAGINGVLGRALSREPENRFGSNDEMVRALGALNLKVNPAPLIEAIQHTSPVPPSEGLTTANSAWQVKELVRLKKGIIDVLAWSPDGTLIAVASSSGVYFYTAQSLEQVRFISMGTWVYSVAFSPDGTLLASGTADSSVGLWRVADGSRLRTLKGHIKYVFCVTFSPDGTILASGSNDYNVRLWRVSDGSLLCTLEGHTDRVNSVAFSTDGRILASGSCDQSIRLWRVSDGSLLHTLEGHNRSVNSVNYSPDGNTLASGSDDGTVRLWRVSDGTLQRTLQGHTGYVLSVAFSPDGSTLASGSGDATIRLWRFADSSLLRTLEAHTDSVNIVAFSPNGSLCASGSFDGTVRLWGVAP